MVIQECALTFPSITTKPAAPGRLRAELERVRAGGSPLGFVRDDVLASWRESATLGVRPDRLDLPYDPDAETETALLRAGRPALDRLDTDLDGTEISVVLGNERSRVVDRRAADRREEQRLDRLTLAPGYHWGVGHAGTNGLAVACTNGSPTLIHGDEHFVDALTPMTSAGAPVRDPRTGRMLGALALVCSREVANTLLLPVANRAAHEIERRLLNGMSVRERLLQEQFLRARRRARGPLALVSSSILLSNAAAARFARPADQPGLWDLATRVLRAPGENGSAFTFADRTERYTNFEPVWDGSELAGALIHFPRRVKGDTASGRSGTRSSAPGRATLGWENLTETERSLAELIAEGLTNREAAARLFLSRHTVDSHLRRIFRKLDINSRVELASIATRRSVELRPPPPVSTSE
jgi:transcriptional regulator of acetoin/glycerol metabolism